MYAALRIIEPPAAEPIDIPTVRRHCRVDASYDDDLLALYLTTARTWAENYLNRCLITTHYSYTVTTAPPPTASPLVPQSLIVFPLNWPPVIRKPIALPRAPCVSVESVKWGPVDDMTDADPNDYTINLDVEPAQVMVKGPLVPMLPAVSLALEYTAGYGADGAAVPAPIIAAILLLTAYLYEGRGDVNSAGPDAAWQLLAAYRLYQFA